MADRESLLEPGPAHLVLGLAHLEPGPAHLDDGVNRGAKLNVHGSIAKFLQRVLVILPELQRPR